MACLSAYLTDATWQSRIRFVSSTCNELPTKLTLSTWQSRICRARLVGELYVYRLLQSPVVMRVLYWLVPKVQPSPDSVRRSS